MARRSGQSGVVVVKGDWYHGRYYVDVPGLEERVRKSMPIGRVKDMTKPQAKRKLTEMLNEMGVNSSAHLDRALQPIRTFAEEAKWWEENTLIHHKPSSRNSSHYIIKKHLIPHFGEFALSDIDKRKAQEWVTVLDKQGKLAPKTVHNMWKVLRLIMGESFTNVRVKLPSIPEEEQRFFTPEESKMIIDAAEGQYKILFALQFATGMRFGEAAGLHVDDLDFKESVIRIRRSTFVHLEVSTKTKAGHREIDVDPETMKMVKKYLGDRQSGRVFESKKGTPLVNGNVNRYVLKPLCKELKLPIGTTHAFRHGRVSVLQQNSVPGDLIKRWIGHTSLRTTSKYSHFTPEFRKQAAKNGIK